MIKLFTYVILPLLSLAGIGNAVEFTPTKESKNIVKLAHALPAGLVDTYDVVTLSDITRYADNTVSGGIDLTNPDNDGFFHKSDTNTTGSVVFKFKQLIPTYAKTFKTVNVVLRGTNYYNDGFEFYHTDNDWRSVQIRVKNESNKGIAEWWGGASGNIFKDNVTHEVEVGAINYASGNKIYCYYMLDGVLITSADYENSNNYDFNHPYVGVRASSTLNSTLSDSDDHRLVANFSNNSWTTDNDFLLLNVDEMANYAAMSTNGFNGWGHFYPSSGATLQYQHVNGNNQNLTSLALPFNNVMAINLAYNGISRDYVENDRLVISGLFRQETSVTNHINAVFSVTETRLIYYKGMWRSEATKTAADEWAQSFNETGCSTTKSNWGTLAGTYANYVTQYGNAFSSIFLNEAHIDHSVPEEGLSDVTKAVQRYDYVLELYGVSDANTDEAGYQDFIGRVAANKVTPKQNARVNIFGASINNNGMIIFIIVSLVAISAFAGYFLLRKKEQND